MKMRAFETRKGTQLAFSAIRLGTAPLGEIYEILDERTSIATVEQALASGVRLFDTSPHYGNGIAESRIGAGLRHTSEATSWSRTKIGRVMDLFVKPPPRNKRCTRRGLSASNRCFARASVRSTSCSMTATSGPMVARPGAASPSLTVLVK